MKNKYLILLSTFIMLYTNQINAQTYGNWSGVLYTSSAPAENVDLSAYPTDLADYVHQNFTGKYVKIIIYVTYPGEKYTVSIKYPQNGETHGLTFTGLHPDLCNGFSSTIQNHNNPGCYWVERWNITNQSDSNCDRMAVVIVTWVPNQEFYLKIDHPAVDDATVDSALPNPGCTSDITPYYWGSINNTVHLMGCSSSEVGSNQKNQIKIYPNPAEDKIIVQTDDNFSYKIFSIDGKLIKKGFISDEEHQIDISALLPATYILKYKIGQEEHSQYLIVD